MNTDNTINQNASATTSQAETGSRTALDYFFKYIVYWKWFALSLIICFGIAYAQLRYATPIYSVSAKVIISTDNRATGEIDPSAFSDLGLSGIRNSLETEIAVLTSRQLCSAVGDSLRLNITYFKEGRIKNTEIYKGTPVTVSIPNVIRAGSFILGLDSANNLTISNAELGYSQPVKYGEEIATPWGMATFNRNPFGQETLPVTVNVTRGSSPGISVLSNTGSSIIYVSAKSSVPEKAADIVNTIIELYNKKTVAEKNQIASNTIAYIRERERLLYDELDQAERDVEQFNLNRGAINLQSQRAFYLQNTNAFDMQIHDTDVQLELLRNTKQFLLDPKNEGELVPTNIGLTDGVVLGLLGSYNQMILDKRENTQSMKGTHTTLKEYNDRIIYLKNNVLNGIAQCEEMLNFRKTDLKNLETQFSGMSRDLTVKERESRELNRRQTIKESLYIYLSQKREEVGITTASATPNAKVIERAEAVYGVPISPVPSNKYSTALIAGLAIPLVIIYIISLLDNKIHGREDVIKTVKAPFLGEIPMLKNPAAFPVLKVKSSIAEQFRTIVSNLDFVVGGKQRKIVQITSSTGSEGKSFFSRNLALSLATTGRKTLLVDLDMRKSVMVSELELKTKSGIALYLSDPEVKLKDIVDTSFHKNLTIMPVKVFPPNPAELLVSERMKHFFDEIGDNYEYIIIDTAPIGLVSDAYSINRFVDATIFLVRADYTFRRSLVEIQNLYRENRLKNLTCVLNATEIKKHGYGRYGYGYGYGKYGYGYGNDKNYYHEED